MRIFRTSSFLKGLGILVLSLIFAMCGKNNDEQLASRTQGGLKAAGAIPIGSIITLKGYNNMFVTSNNGTTPMTCDRATASTWEQFTVVDAGGGLIALKGSNGMYVSSENGAITGMNCNRASYSGWEVFTWVSVGTNQVQLKAQINSQFVSQYANGNGTGPIACNRATASGWETFTFAVVGGTSGGSSVSWYLTNTDGSAKFAQQSNLNWSSGSNSNSTITVNTGTSYQGIDGFGFCLTEASAQVISGMSASSQSTLLNDLFSTSGIGISVVRIAIGASDLSNSDYTYQDGASFSLAGPDLTYVIPILQKILAINSSIKILATPWTAPLWMKNQNAGTWVGGTLNNGGYSTYQQYANYWLAYLNAMKAQGINIWAITPQNEPENPYNNPSMTMSSSEEANFINSALGPTLRNAGYTTKIICYDHNCDDVAYPEYVLSNASAYVDGSAFHLYAGDIKALTTVHNYNTSKNVYFTEQYTASSGSFAGDFPWHIQNVMIGAVNNWARISLEWNLAANTSNGPNTSGGCTTCLPAVTVNGSSYTKNVSYYIVAHMSKFVRPGATRINTSSNDGSLVNVGFTSGSNKVLVVQNNNGSAKTFNISYSGQIVTATMAGNSAATFVWQ
jgi:glucosylceramidase